MKLNVKQTLLIGFGFFASSIAWSIYNSFVPPLLEKYVQTTTLIGLIMTIDNVFGVIFQPLFGDLSDRTRTRFGRRMPFILIGLPICALLFIAVPWTTALWSMMAVLVVFNLIMSFWRAPMIALMPDFTPRPLRSKANGLINLMGGIGSLIAFVAGSWLLTLGNKTMGEERGMAMPFLAVGLLMIVAFFVLLFFVREPKTAQAAEAPEEPEAKMGLAGIKGVGKSLILVLLAIFFWFSGYNAIETFFSLYVSNHMGLDVAQAPMLLAFFSVTFIAMAVPAGLIATKIGRRKTILIGLGLLIPLFPVLTFVTNLWVFRALMLFGGAMWAMVNINSLPMVLDMGALTRAGRMTGFYYFFSFGASIVSPILYGVIRDLTKDYSTLFWYGGVAYLAAFICMLFVKHGESTAVHVVAQTAETDETAA